MAGLPKPLRILLEEFSSAWDPASPPAFERSLRLAAEANPLLMRDNGVHQEFVIELVKIDLEFRWRNSHKSGRSIAEPHLIENYVGRIPELGLLDRVPLDLIKAEYGDRHSWGDSPEPDEYLRRFPQWGEELRERLAEHLLEVNLSGAKLPDIPGIVCEKLIGTGGFGLVFRAKQQDVQSRKVAVKLLRPMIDSSTGSEEKKARSRLQDEVNKLAKITHSNVIRLYDANTTSPTPYLVMEYAARGSLRELLPRLCRRLKDSDADKVKVLQQGIGRITRDVAKGLNKIHSEKLIHRDLKPENILFDDVGEAKITDFGLAQFFDEELSTQGAQGGTRPYMAPEQIISPKAIDERADIYALGVILYEMLTGERPFTLESQTLDWTRDPQSPCKRNPHVHRDLETVCLKCLEKAPADRYQDAAAIGRDLELFCDGRPIVTPPRTITRRVVRFVQRHKTWLIFSVVLLAGATISFMTIDSLRRVVTGQVSDIKKHEKVTAEKTEEAKKKTKEAAEAEELKRLHDYAADMQELSLKWEAGEMDKAKVILRRNDPAANSGQKDLRGFEWFYWDHLLRPRGWEFDNGEYSRCMVVTADNTKLICAGRMSVTMWNLATGKNEHRWTLCPSRTKRFSVPDDQHYPDRSIAISRDQRLIAATGFYAPEFQRGNIRAGGPSERFVNLKVWDLKTGAEVLSVANDQQISGRAVTFSPDGSLIIAGGYHHGWKSWNVATKQPGPFSVGVTTTQSRRIPDKELVAGTIFMKPEEIVTFLAFTPDGKRLYSSSSIKGGSTSWSWPDRKEDPQCGIGSDDVVPGGVISVSADGKVKLACCDPLDHKLLLHEPVFTGRKRPSPNNTQSSHLGTISLVDAGGIESVYLTESHVVGGGVDHHVHLWSLFGNPSKTTKMDILRGHNSTVTSVTIAPDGRVVSSDALGIIRFWPRRNPEIVDLDEGSKVRAGSVKPAANKRFYRTEVSTLRGNDFTLEVFCEKTLRLLLKVKTAKAHSTTDFENAVPARDGSEKLGPFRSASLDSELDALCDLWGTPDAK